jgi:hypothetical protein
METAAPPARTVVDEAMERATQALDGYLHDPTDANAENYARAFVQLRIALEVLAHQTEEQAA